MNSTTMEAKRIALLSSLIFSLDDDKFSVWKALAKSIDVVWAGLVFLIRLFLGSSPLHVVLYRLPLQGDATDMEKRALACFGSHC